MGEEGVYRFVLTTGILCTNAKWHWHNETRSLRLFASCVWECRFCECLAWFAEPILCHRDFARF